MVSKTGMRGETFLTFCTCANKTLKTTSAIKAVCSVYMLTGVSTATEQSCSVPHESERECPHKRLKRTIYPSVELT